MARTLVYGIDLGINNVGWAAVEKSDGEVEILAMGTYVFDSPLANENDPAEGLKSKIRGQKRRARKTGQRRRQRKQRLYRLLADHGLVPTTFEERAKLFCAEPNPYCLRAKALTEKLELFEVGRAICHLNQKRAFLSPRDLMLYGVAKFKDEDLLEGSDDDASEEAKETGQILSEIRRTKEEMKGFETIGAYLWHRLQHQQPVRKKKLKNVKPAQQKAEDERRFVRAERHMIAEEFDLIWARQAQYHPILTNELKAQVRNIIFAQRNLAADPKTRGHCIFCKEELRMPRASLTAQRYVLAQDVAHLEILEPNTATFRKLRPDERVKLVAKLMEGHDLSWSEVKQSIGVPIESAFNVEPVKVKGQKGAGTSGKKEKLRASQTVNRIKAIIGEKWEALGAQAQRELVGEMISIRDWVGQETEEPAAVRRRNLFLRKAYGPGQVTFTEQEANRLATVELPAGYLNVSLKAAKKILPHLLEDKVYSDACKAAGFDHANPEGELQILDRLPYPTEDDIPHAVVRASVRSAVRVLNALHREFGKPDAIHIELPRDLSLGAKARLEKELEIKKATKRREEIAKRLIEINIRPTRDNIRKVQLWEELGGKGLALEPEVIISGLEDLFRGGYDIGHIVPRGHSLDNSMGNLFLCTERFNRQIQGNRTPYEALGHTAEWPKIVAHVNSLKAMPPNKRRKLLAKERPEDFTGRHLAATGWISREVLKLAQRMVTHQPNALVVPGRATADLRSFWELEGLVPLHPIEEIAEREYREWMDKVDRGEAISDEYMAPPSKNRSNFFHHAVDALVVALTDRGALQAMAQYYQMADLADPALADKERRKAERARRLPDPNLRAKARAALDRAEVVHRPNRRPTGELHKQMPEEKAVQGMPPGEPWSSKVIGNYLVNYDAEGKAAQAYPLGSNHHCIIWERTEPNKKGVYERMAEVVPTIEAVRRRNAGEPVIQKQRPGLRFVMALCKGDMVEMTDGTLAVVSRFSPKPSGKDVDLYLWHVYVAHQLISEVSAHNHKAKKDPQLEHIINPYLVARYQSAPHLLKLASRVVLNPLGRVVYREGGAP
ncbi:MAG: type II CRISPR RNA-guided endonuclease Cas9 [Fimbriimonadaceae bacterium]